MAAKLSLQHMHTDSKTLFLFKRQMVSCIYKQLICEVQSSDLTAWLASISVILRPGQKCSLNKSVTHSGLVQPDGRLRLHPAYVERENLESTLCL